MAVVSPASAATDVAAVYTTSGNEITDAVRVAARSWTTAQQGGAVDNYTPPAGVGIWRSATNLFRRGQCDTLVDWNASGTGTTTRSLDTTTPPPFSTQSVKLVTGGVLAGEGVDASTASGQAAVAGTVGTGSVWVKGVAGQSYNAFNFWANTDASFSIGATINFTATGDWQLITPAAVAVGVGKTGDSLRLRVATATARAETFWTAHAMLESGQPVASPYVATSGGAPAFNGASRVQVPTSPLTVAQGWCAARLIMGYANTALNTTFPFVLDWRNDGNNRLALFLDASTDKFGMSAISGGVNVTSSWSALAWAQGDAITVIGVWGPSGVAISVNGGAFTAFLAATIPALTIPNADLGSAVGTSNWLNSNVAWLAIGGGTLTNADAAAIAALPTAMPALYPPVASSPIYTWQTYRPIGPKFRRVRVGEPVVVTE